MKVVNQPIMKKDAMALVTGKPVFTNDKAPKECLIVKLLRSPYAIAFMIIPGLQNPHCSAPWFAIKAPNSAASSCSPSKVSILCPSTLAARMEHDKIGWSSINTVHNPQFDVSHPRFTL